MVFCLNGFFAAIPVILRCTEIGLPLQTVCPCQDGIMRYGMCTQPLLVIVVIVVIVIVVIVVIVEIKTIARIIKIIMIPVIMPTMTFYKNVYFWQVAE